jgi:hypothetical protein
MKTNPVGQNFPTIAADAAATAAVRHYGPAHLARGGAVGRARAEVRRGQPAASAARRVSKNQAKGHAAELRVAAEQSIDAGLRGHPFGSRPNPIANDPHVDVEVMSGNARISDAQVGVGAATYLRTKINTSQATQVIINSETRERLRTIDPKAYARSSDRLQYGETSSKPLVSEVVERDAAGVLEDVLSGSGRVSELFKLATASGAGLEAAVTSFGRSLLFGVVHRLANDQPVDGKLVDEAIDAGVDAFLKAGVHAYVIVSDFLDVAGALFDSRLLRSVGGKIAVAGAIADVVITTARDVVAHLRGQITFDELLKRAIVATLAAVGGVAGFAVALKAGAGLPPWAQILLTIGLTWGASWVGSWLGKQLTEPSSPLVQPTRYPAGGYIKL